MYLVQVRTHTHTHTHSYSYNSSIIVCQVLLQSLQNCGSYYHTHTHTHTHSYSYNSLSTFCHVLAHVKSLKCTLLHGMQFVVSLYRNVSSRVVQILAYIIRSVPLTARNTLSRYPHTPRNSTDRDIPLIQDRQCVYISHAINVRSIGIVLKTVQAVDYVQRRI